MRGSPRCGVGGTIPGYKIWVVPPPVVASTHLARIQYLGAPRSGLQTFCVGFLSQEDEARVFLGENA